MDKSNDTYVPPQLKAQDRTYSIMVTTYCNIRCRYCYEVHKDEVVVKLADAKKFLKWIVDRSKAIDVDRVGVKLMGGEVLRFPKLMFDIVEYGEKLFFSNGIFVSWFFSTNGTSYSVPGVMDFIKKYYKHLYIKNISLDGSPRSHDRNRVYEDGTGTMAEILKDYDEASVYMNTNSIDTDIDFNYVLAVNCVDTFAYDLEWYSKYVSKVVNVIQQDSGIYFTADHVKTIGEQLGILYEKKKAEVAAGIVRPLKFYVKKNKNERLDPDSPSCCCYDLEIGMDANGNVLPCVGLNHTIFGDDYKACHVRDLKVDTDPFNATCRAAKEYLDDLGKEKRGGMIMCMARYMGKKEDLSCLDFKTRAEVANLFFDFNDKMQDLYGV